MRIDIIPEDIKNGVRGNSQSCPAARAIRSRLRLSKSTKVTVDGMRITVNGFTLRTPPDLADFIRSFDTGRPCSPTSFEVEVPSALAEAAS